jgi:DNA-binding beta-propeller fold protein YncE
MRAEGDGSQTRIAELTNATQTVYVDTSVKLGERYTYQVTLENSLGASATSDTAGITAGVFTLVENSRIGELTFAPASPWLFASIPDLDQVWVIDVTGNNIDHQIDVGDLPWGVCANGQDGRMYIANSSDASVSVLSASAPSSSSRYTIGLPSNPLYLDYFERDSVLFATMATNDYPLIITENSDASQTVDTLEDSRLRLIQGGSTVRVDDVQNRLYVSEIGNFAAGLWQYSVNVNGSSPTFLRTIDQGALGYGLQDFAIRPPTSGQLLVAATSPYSVTIVAASSLAPTDSLLTGPYPNAVTISPDGATAYIALSSNDVQLWDIATGTLQQSVSFADPVLRGAIAISPDGNFLAVATYDADVGDSRITLLYLGP